MPEQHEQRSGERAAVALGSNQGARAVELGRAVEELASLLTDLRCSSVYETEPVGAGGQRPFLNMCCAGSTSLGAVELLERLLAAEEEAGRPPPSGERRGVGRGAAGVRGGPRPLDLDLLLYGEQTRDEPGLTVPHPRMHRRAFVLVPLAEVAGGWRHPVLGRTVGELAAKVGAGGVRPYEGPLPDSLRRRIDPGGG